MITRLLTKEDLPQFSQVSATAYIHDGADTEFDETRDIFGTFLDDGKTLISQVECGFKNCFYGGKALLCAAVSGVASKPEYRRLGGVRLAFDGVFENAKKKGCSVSILYPFSIAYYRKFGYETIFKYIRATCSFKAFEKIERFSEVTVATEEYKDIMTDIYTKIAKKSNMMFERKDGSGFCLTPYSSCRYTYFVNDGNSAGYVFFTPDRAARTVTVDEILFTDKTALIKLLGFLRTYDGNYDTVIFDKLPLDTPVLGMINNENLLVKREILYGGAGRILDIEAVLKANKYPSSYGKFSVKITDKQIEENNGIFTVEYENGECNIQKSSHGDYDLALDSSAAARLLLGREGLTLEEIGYIDNVEIKSDCEAFIRAFPKATTRFYEGF